MSFQNSSHALQSAFSQHLSGNLKEAEKSYQNILKREPKNHEAMHLLGMVSYHRGKKKQAIKLIKNAISLNPSTPAYHNNLGEVYRSQHRYDDAIECYTRAINLDKNYINAYNNLGNVYYEQNDFDKAFAHYKHVVNIDPNHIEAYYNLGILSENLNKIENAESFYRTVLSKEPSHIDANYKLGILLSDQNRPSEAESFFYTILNIEPNNWDAKIALGLCLFVQNKTEQAIDIYHKALNLKPDHIPSLVYLARLYYRIRKFDNTINLCNKILSLNSQSIEALNLLGLIAAQDKNTNLAISYYKKAIEIDPSYYYTYNNIACALEELEEYDDAIKYFTKAINYAPDFVEPYNNLGSVYFKIGNKEKAISFLNKALEIDPSYPDPKWNLSLIKLKEGQLSDGWELYEYRMKTRKILVRTLPYPMWDGSSLQNKNILVYSEQGIGDEIMFMSCLPDLVNENPRKIIIECSTRLVPLVKRSFPYSVVIDTANHSHSSYKSSKDINVDYQIPLGSLPKFYRKKLTDFHGKPYLNPAQEQIELWRDRYKVLGPGLKVGISWRSGSLINAKSTTIEQWITLLKCDAHFINLQYGDSTEELRNLQDKYGIHVYDWDDVDPLKNIDFQASQIAALDLVISIDNATVQIAGAVGIETWVLLSHISEWRWMSGKDSCPWFHNMKLFRQDNPNDWNSLFNSVRHCLTKKIIELQ